MTGNTRFGHGLKFILVVVAIAYLSAAGYLYAAQRSFVFRPDGHLVLPAEKGLAGVDIVRLEGAGGVSLTAWYAEPDEGMPTFLYFMGNAGNISGRAERYRKIRNAGFGMLIPSYRGYPGSSGAPSESGFIADGLLVFDWLKQRSQRIVIYGESLGTGVATAVAAERDGIALILEAPFSAALDLAAKQYRWLPVSLLMKDQFRSRDRIGLVREPVLIVHGTNDATIPIAQGRDLLTYANDPKRMHEINGGGHGGLWNRGLWEAVQAFVNDLQG